MLFSSFEVFERQTNKTLSLLFEVVAILDGRLGCFGDCGDHHFVGESPGEDAFIGAVRKSFHPLEVGHSSDLAPANHKASKILEKYLIH